MNALLKNLFVLFLLAGLSACVDLEFDAPPVDGEDPGITPNATIAQVKSLYKPGGFAIIDQDWIIGGVVVADDRSGNFFRSIILQDETSGIEVRINQTNAYNFYPIGRQLFIRCKGLIIGDSNGVPQLGGYLYIENGAQQLGDIVELNDRIIKGKRTETPAPRVRTIAELSEADISSLVRIENVEFADADVGQTFADPVGRRTLNRTIRDCRNGTITLRTSGFSIFAGQRIPEGNGSITAIYSVFGTTKQLFIREISDINMTGARCSGGGGGNTNDEPISIQEIRALFRSGASNGPAGRKIVGVVISDRTSNNWDGRNLVVQDATAGIAVRFQTNHSFNLGDQIEVSVGGQELSEFNGLLQINNIAPGQARGLGVGTLPVPREVTVNQIIANLETWESTLVRIVNGTLSGGTTYSGTRRLADATGSMDLFTRSQATFSGQALPTGPVNVVAVLSQFNNAQLVLRNLDDVTTGSGGGGGGDPGGSGDLLTLQQVRNLFKSGTTSGPAGRKIRGVVISDRENNNWDGRNLVIQDSTGGIVVRFQNNHTFALGQLIEINIASQELSLFNGLLQVNNVTNTNAQLIGAGTLPTPREATISQILANQEAWESTLVRIKNATIASGSYSGSKNVTDGTGTVVMFTRTQASFASQTVPSGAVEITAVLSKFNTPQIIIRNTSDVKP